jgi:hypothetical protein
MGFPANVPNFIEGKRPGKKRAHATMKGTRKHPLPNVGTPGPHRPPTWQKLLSAQGARFKKSARKG